MDNQNTAQHLVFSVEATFHTGSKVDRHNLRMRVCGTEGSVTFSIKGFHVN
jgi:hypothetical protein